MKKLIIVFILTVCISGQIFGEAKRIYEGEPFIGDEVHGGTPGSILFVDPLGNLGQDNANLYWDDTSDLIGIGTNTPTEKVHIYDSSDNIYVLIETDKTNGAAGIIFQNDAQAWQLSTTFNDGLTFRDVTGLTNVIKIFPGSPVNSLVINTGGLGYFGIGIASPTAKLEIDGMMKSTGAIISGEVSIGTTTSSPNALFVVGNATFTGIVSAPSFNIVGSAYQANGIDVIKGDRTFYANTSTPVALTIGNQTAGVDYEILFNANPSIGRMIYDVSKDKFVFECSLEAHNIYALDTMAIGTTTTTGVLHVSTSPDTVALFVEDNTGNIGVGTDTPSTKLEVNGYTMLGSTAPAIKMVKISSTTPGVGAMGAIVHGFADISKIIGAQVLVSNNSGNRIPPNFKSVNDHEFDFFIDEDYIHIYCIADNSSNIDNNSVTILITYEE